MHSVNTMVISRVPPPGTADVRNDFDQFPVWLSRRTATSITARLFVRYFLCQTLGRSPVKGSDELNGAYTG